MKFLASAEVFQEAFAALDRVHRSVEPFLNTAFATSSLANLECNLRYVPIIMPIGMRERYPARSKLRKRDRIYDCAPQLDYNAFVEGTFADQLREYLRGIALSAPHLRKLGASPEQVAEFERIVTGATQSILARQADRLH